MSSAYSNSTPILPDCEFTRRASDGGIELFRRVDGVETVTPVQTTVKTETYPDGRKALIIGFEPKPIQINWPNGQTTFLAVEDGVYQNHESGEWEVWLEGEAVAWCDTEKQANRSFSELVGEAY